MKKNIIALAILTTVSSTAVASNAVLNVEGQIQINGETVIGSDGKVLASALPSSGAVMVDLAKYSPKPGKYTYQFQDYRYVPTDDNYWEEKNVTCTETDEFTSDTSYEYYQECKFEGTVVSWFEESWQDNGDGTETYTTSEKWGDQEVNSYTQTNKVERLAEYAQLVELGTTTSYVEKGTLVSTDNEWAEVGSTWFYARNKLISGVISSIDINEETYSDCILMTNTRNWNGVASLDIYCADIGLVQRTTDTDWSSNYHLISYTHDDSKGARSLSASGSVSEKVSDLAKSRVATSLLKRNN